MATKSMTKLVGEGGASFEVRNTDGVASILLDGDTVISSQQAAIASLSQNISATYVEAEVQAISDKVDAILAMLRSAGIIAT